MSVNIGLRVRSEWFESPLTSLKILVFSGIRFFEGVRYRANCLLGRGICSNETPGTPALRQLKEDTGFLDSRSLTLPAAGRVTQRAAGVIR